MNRLDDKEKIIKYLEKSTLQINGCWIYYGGSKTKDGYRRIRVSGKVVGVHRLSAYIFHNLNLDDSSQQANHKDKCSTKTCWNPEHIYVGTHKQNINDYLRKGHYNSLKTYCKFGHTLTQSTTIGKRRCVICARAKSKIYSRNKKHVKA